MPADVRDVSATVSEGTGSIARPDDAQPGDTLILFASTWVDPMDELGPPSGGWGEPIAQRQGVDNGGAKVWKRVLTSADPTTYTVPNPEDFADATLAILAVKGADPAAVQVTTSGQSGVTAAPSTPGITPDVASSLEIRYVSGVPHGPNPADRINTPAGFDSRAVQDDSAFVKSTLATRTLSSSAPVGQVTFPTASGQLRNYVGFTIIIGSRAGGSSGPPPTPPQFPAFIPSRGQAVMRYTAHQALTGDYVGDLSGLGVRQVSMDRREREAGAWEGFLPFPDGDRRKANQIKEILPENPDDLSSGPGRLVVHSWRSGRLWSMNWLHTQETIKDPGLGWGIKLAGTTLDGYLQSVAISDPAGVELEGDQLDNARDFILHAGQDPRSNFGFTLGPGTSGVVRPLVAKLDDFYGKVLRDYATAGDGFAYVVDPTVTGGSIQRLIRFGSPYLQLDTEYVFGQGRHGGEVVSWQEVGSALSGGTRIGVIGGTPEPEDATEATEPVRSSLIETPHLAAGWPIIDLRLQHPRASTDASELQRYGEFYARTAAGAPRVFSAELLIGRDHEFDPNSLGAVARFKLGNDWHAGGERRRRIIGWTLTPGESGTKDRLEVILAQEAA